jgi:hypothetical protein
MTDRFTTPYAKALVQWEQCWIRVEVLEKIRKAVMRLKDEDQQEDIRAALAEETAGKEILTVSDLPPKLKRILSL